MRHTQRDEISKSKSFRAAFKAADARMASKNATCEDGTERLMCVRCGMKEVNLAIPSANGSKDAVCAACATAAEIATVAGPV